MYVCLPGLEMFSLWRSQNPFRRSLITKNRSSDPHLHARIINLFTRKLRSPILVWPMKGNSVTPTNSLVCARRKRVIIFWWFLVLLSSRMCLEPLTNQSFFFIYRKNCQSMCLSFQPLLVFLKNSIDAVMPSVLHPVRDAYITAVFVQGRKGSLYRKNAN